MRIYTRRGDDGTTALRTGGRVGKDDPLIELLGTVDEAQAHLGLARAEVERNSALDVTLTRVERDLWVLMAEIATAPNRRDQLEPGVTAVDAEMVRALEHEIDAVMSTLELKSNFAVPGENRRAALLDVARTVVRRAERLATRPELAQSQIGSYLNRLSDLCWALARAQEQEHPVHEKINPGTVS